jgi:hypothetical protein
MSRALAADPDARLAIFPCDHRFRREDAFVEAVRRAEHGPGSGSFFADDQGGPVYWAAPVSLARPR